MNLATLFSGMERICIDSTPFIYLVEENPDYVDLVEAIFRIMDQGLILGFTSVITLTEVLNKPMQNGNLELVSAYRSILLNSRHFSVMPITVSIAESAAHLRARYNLRTPDALQIAVAIEANCDAFLTNDLALKRVNELKILCLDELEP